MQLPHGNPKDFPGKLSWRSSRAHGIPNVCSRDGKGSLDGNSMGIWNVLEAQNSGNFRYKAQREQREEWNSREFSSPNVVPTEIPALGILLDPPRPENSRIFMECHTWGAPTIPGCSNLNPWTFPGILLATPPHSRQEFFPIPLHPKHGKHLQGSKA